MKSIINMDNYRNIGKIVASFGLKGELILLHRLGKKTALKGLETIFLEDKNGGLLPYFIQQLKIKSDTEIYLKLEGIETKEGARQVLQKEVWLPETAVSKYADKTAPISLVGFQMVDDGKPIGEIAEVIEQPHQVLCRVDLDGKEALIPIHEGTLESVDKKNKLVHVRLPDGLLDVYR